MTEEKGFVESSYFSVRFRKDAWHSRLHYFVYSSHSRRISICKYFWATLSAPALFPLALVWHLLSDDWKDRITIGWLYVSGGTIAFIIWIQFFEMGTFVFLQWVAYTVLGGAGIMGGLYAIVRLALWLEEKKNLRMLHFGWKPKQPSMVIAYLMAKKARICPIIQWEETHD